MPRAGGSRLRTQADVAAFARPLARTRAPLQHRCPGPVTCVLPVCQGGGNLRVLSGVGAQPRAGRVDEVLDLVTLSDRASDRYETYSLGMKQRLGIAAALLNDPPLLLLDEPANGLDPAGIVDMRTLLQALAGAGETVFVSFHILPEIQQMADEVAIIAHGRLVCAGPLDDLLRQSGEVRIHVEPDALPRANEVLAHVAAGVIQTAMGQGGCLSRPHRHARPSWRPGAGRSRRRSPGR